MKQRLVLLVIVWSSLWLHAQEIRFDDYFVNQTLRIDVYHSGDAAGECFTLDRMQLEGEWAGPTRRLSTPFDLGRHAVSVFDKESGKLIYAWQYDSIFGEYRTTTPAIKGEKRTYHETVLIPLPKKKIRLEFAIRDRFNNLQQALQKEIDPQAIEISRAPLSNDVKVLNVQKMGAAHDKVDLVFVAEGYSAAEEGKFSADLQRLSGHLFGLAPFAAMRDKFNIYGVFKTSPDSGCSEPEKHIYKNTILHSSFNALGLDRYLLSEDNRALRDLAAHVPCDKLVILVNAARYGGGGIYNTYAITTVDHPASAMVLAHEFGHMFAGLADEYYDASIAYNDYYPPGIEPREPNITRLLDPAHVKWAHLLTPGVPVPTPWEKASYDNLGKVQAAPSVKKPKTIEQIFKQSPYAGKVGVFEGAGYLSTGMYRSMLQCLMFSQNNGAFCRACADAIARTIVFYCD